MITFSIVFMLEHNSLPSTFLHFFAACEKIMVAKALNSICVHNNTQLIRCLIYLCDILQSMSQNIRQLNKLLQNNSASDMETISEQMP